MNVEQRARVHAALADPTRLRIADRLAAGDASPSELQALLDVPSNLLAHHLGVLADAGIVDRHRSEADRRRSYLRLLPDALAGLEPGGALAVPRVVFVCTANSARSQLAAALWARASEVPATSAGTHPATSVAPGAARAARRRGLELVQPPQQLVDVTAASDYLVAVCDRAYEELGSRAVHVHWSVPDPVRVGTAAAYDAAYDDLARRVSRLAPRLTPAS
jgi:ArsR family transcriptional regulator, arsenate/arsenite/antimonite-responsive transcriptional repressor / arsenate reductase (thioredoxin)